MGTLGFGGVGISRGGGVRKAAPPGSVYRSPQVFEKLWPFKEAVYQGLGVGSAKPSSSERKVENMGRVNYGPYMFDKKVYQGLGVGSAKPSSSERKVENMGRVNYGPYMFDKKVVQETIDPNALLATRLFKRRLTALVADVGR